ncbi:MAG: hypothetical protein WAW81_01955 [Minisyncoccia bacterium]
MKCPHCHKEKIKYHKLGAGFVCDEPGCERFFLEEEAIEGLEEVDRRSREQFLEERSLV